MDITGKKLLVVGGTSGLGQAISKEALARGADVTVVGRSFKDGDTEIQFRQADLSKMTEAKRIGEEIAPVPDAVVFTTGIVPAAKRETSSEGIEMDMAVSYLSRLVILKYLVPRLAEGSRVFIMGFPGSDVKFNMDDLNAEKSYAGGFGFVHFNTVVGNEALVIEYSSNVKTVSFFGLNPGLIKTGIRSNMYTGIMRVFAPIMEGMIGMFGTSPQGYAKKMVSLMFAKDLEKHSGSNFNPKAQPTLRAKHFEDDDGLAARFIEESEKLVKEKTGIEL